MKKNRIILFVAALALLALSLAACQMPASTPPPGLDASPTSGDTDFPRPEDVTNPFEGLEMAATQTAMAESGGQQPGTTETPGQPEVQPTQPDQQAQPTQAPAPTATSAPQSNVPSPTPGVPATYTIMPGEFPYCIARRFNVNPSELLALNGLSRFSTVLPGTTLSMPQTGNPWPGNRALISTPDTYTVRAGDTIYKIACTYGHVDPYYMAAVNGISAPYSLEVGQTLQIP
jgi:LysM repeat protein